MTKLKRHILNFGPVAWFIRFSKRTSPPGFQGLSLYDVVHFFNQHSKKIGFNERAAAISFNIIIALPAGLMFLFTLVPYLQIANQFQREFIKTIHDVLRNDRIFGLVKSILDDIFDVLKTRRGGLLSVSIFVAFFFASNAMMGIMRTFDRSFYQQRSRRFMAKRWTAIKLTGLLLLLILATGLLLTTQVSLRKLLQGKWGRQHDAVWYLLHYTRWAIILLLNFFSIAFIYKYAPAVKVRWKTFSPGAVLATLLTILTSYLFSIWVNNFGKYNQLYGSLSTVLLLMNLIFFNALVLLIGFEFNVSITLLKAQRIAESTTGTATMPKEISIPKKKEAE